MWHAFSCFGNGTSKDMHFGAALVDAQVDAEHPLVNAEQLAHAPLHTRMHIHTYTNTCICRRRHAHIHET